MSGSGYLAVLLMIRAGGTPEGITIYYEQRDLSGEVMKSISFLF